MKEIREIDEISKRQENVVDEKKLKQKKIDSDQRKTELFNWNEVSNSVVGIKLEKTYSL